MSTINFSGLASGIDTNALIDATSAATRQTRVTPKEKKVTELEETNSAFDQLETKLNTVRTSLQEFTTLAGGGVSKQASSSRESVVTATASNAATNGSYSVTVSQLAKNFTGSFDTTFGSITAPVLSSINPGDPAVDRTVSFAIGTGSELTTVNVVVTNGSYTISDFVTAFNNATTKATASLVNVGTSASPSYKIVVTSNNEGLNKGQVNITVGASVTSLAASTVSQATDAQLSITGIGTITRSTNTVNDVISGLTLSLSSIGDSTVKVSEDAATTTTKIQAFIDAYNEVVRYIADNNQITRDESSTEIQNVFGPLASTRTDDNALTALRSAISGSAASGGSAVRIFSDLGITTERDGTLKFDTTRLQTAVATEPSSVSSVLQTFADTVAATGGTIDIYTRFNGLFDISTNSNKTLITNLNQQISEAEKQIARKEEELRARFARLESQMSRLQQQQSSLTSALSGLG
jgi:flagellar hook-associated protein 2